MMLPFTFYRAFGLEPYAVQHFMRVFLGEQRSDVPSSQLLGELCPQVGRVLVAHPGRAVRLDKAVRIAEKDGVVRVGGERREERLARPWGGSGEDSAGGFLLLGRGRGRRG